MAASVPAKPQNDLQVFQNNLRTTALGAKFGRALFSEGNGMLSPASVIQAMKALGVNVPDSVEIGVDIAQLFSSGAAAYDAFQAYQGIDDIRSVAGSTAGTAKAAILVADKLGWIDDQSETIQILKTGIDTAMIVASAGMDVTAWISLAMDFASFSMGNKAIAARLAQEGLRDQVKALMTAQSAAAAQVFAQFQASSTLGYADPNYLSVFGMIGKIAQVAPDVWPQYFPNFGWAPETIWTISENSSSTTWYGDTNTDHAEYSFKAFQLLPKSQIQDIVFQGLVLPYLAPYEVMKNAYIDSNKASITTMAILGALTNFDYIDPNADCSVQMKQALLTPMDFGDNVFQDWLDQYETSKSGLIQASPITIDGKAASVPVSDFITTNINQIRALDFAGRMDVLRSVQALQAPLTSIFTFPEINPATGQVAGSPLDQAGIASLKANSNVKMDPREAIVASLTDQINAKKWRYTKNYFAALGMIDQLSHDSWFADWITNGTFGNQSFQSFSFLHTITEVDQLARDVQLKMTLRQVNSLALANIAGFFNTTPDKLIKIPASGTTPVAYRVKG